MISLDLHYFVMESNRIEGINRETLSAEMEAHQSFLKLRVVTVADLQDFVSRIQPGAKLRDKLGMNVRVGNYRPPPGGPAIVEQLEAWLKDIHTGRVPSYESHLRYEALHPFTDGNGRSGRVLWLWQHSGHASLGFLHTFYYQALAASNR